MKSSNDNIKRVCINIIQKTIQKFRTVTILNNTAQYKTIENLINAKLF
jgi:hypothetical protein